MEEVTKIQGQAQKGARLDHTKGAYPRSCKYGHLGLITEEAGYWAISNRGVAFIITKNPGIIPMHLPVQQLHIERDLWQSTTLKWQSVRYA